MNRLWRVIRDPGGLSFPTDRDVLGTVVAVDRQQARRTAERLHGRGVLVVSAKAWPVASESTSVSYTEPKV